MVELKVDDVLRAGEQVQVFKVHRPALATTEALCFLLRFKMHIYVLLRSMGSMLSQCIQSQLCFCS